MGRNTGPKCKLCRAESKKLYLRGNRCDSVKCAITKKRQSPGMKHFKHRSKKSEYGRRLREKQSVKRIYGIREKQFMILFEKAEKMKGDTGYNLLMLIERRFDNVIYRSTFAHSRNHARQLINHGHFLVNGIKTDIASYIVKNGDEITVKNRDKTKKVIVDNIREGRKRFEVSWLEASESDLRVRVVGYPKREEIDAEIEPKIQENLIIEFCSN